jgi:pSer/pThr/pTyr-binding forkhead associated (FHA) protein
MSDQLLNTLKVALLGLLYLFFARVLWAVWTEVRVPTAQGLVAGRLKKSTSGKPKRKAPLGSPSRLLMVEPATMRGSTVSLEDEVTVGRSGECDVTLENDPFASTRHARFFTKDENWYVEDLGSTNGTLVNSYRITQSTRLAVEDRIQVGSTVFEAR